MQKNTEIAVVPRRYLPVFVALVACFALWGVLNNMTDNLVPAFQKIFMTSQSTAGYVQISFYGAYSVVALFASLLVQRAGYRCGVLVGLGVYVIGALLYVPACIAQSFWLYIVGIFVVAGGCAVLETTCNPYVLALGGEKFHNLRDVPRAGRVSKSKFHLGFTSFFIVSIYYTKNSEKSMV